MSKVDTKAEAAASTVQIEGDFPRALKFHELLIEYFGENMATLKITFPPKYDNPKDFMEQFKELDDVERLLWCDHQLKQAYAEYNKRDGSDTARKNILWTLMVCRQNKITLTRDYQLMKMIRELWLQFKWAPTPKQEEVVGKLKDIFAALGETTVEIKKDLRKTIQSSRLPETKKKGVCSCAGDCQIF